MASPIYVLMSTFFLLLKRQIQFAFIIFKISIYLFIHLRWMCNCLNLFNVEVHWICYCYDDALCKKDMRFSFACTNCLHDTISVSSKILTKTNNLCLITIQIDAIYLFCSKVFNQNLLSEILVIQVKTWITDMARLTNV